MSVVLPPIGLLLESPEIFVALKCVSLSVAGGVIVNGN